MQAIVVTFDRLATRLLGCYGNEWIETPNFDRLAARSTVFDNHFADSVGARRGHSWLTGRHSLLSHLQPAVRPLGSALKSGGVASAIHVIEHASDLGWNRAGFDGVQRVSGTNGLEAHPTEVPFANLIRAGIDSVRGPLARDEKRLIWLHAPEPSVPPEGFATLYAEDFEERGIVLNDLPREDWARQIAVAAGSMSLVDHWLGELVECIKAHCQHQPTLLLITGASGRSWADDFLAAACASQIGTAAAALRDMETCCPLILSVFGTDLESELEGVRCQRFVQPMDVAPTLMDWFQLPEVPSETSRSLLQEAVSEQPSRPEVFCSDDESQFAIRNAEWNCLLRLNAEHNDASTICAGSDKLGPEQVQLFSKPEDIWDVTDLATQFPETCDELAAKVMAFRTAGLKVASAT